MPRTAQPNDASSPLPTDEQAATYDRLVPMLEAAHREMTELSKKKQDGIVNALKIKMLNRLLSELSKVIEKDPSMPSSTCSTRRPSRRTATRSSSSASGRQRSSSTRAATTATTRQTTSTGGSPWRTLEVTTADARPPLSASPLPGRGPSEIGDRRWPASLPASDYGRLLDRRRRRPEGRQLRGQ